MGDRGDHRRTFVRANLRPLSLQCRSSLKLILLALLLCGCAQTIIFEDGKPIACIQGDCTNVTVKGRYTYFHADTLNHSTATAAAYTGATAVVGAAGSAVVSGILAFPK